MNQNPTDSPEPQNPYHSFVVSAAAGSGKTHQLTHRFLKLVGAGANPSTILTITFTRKAAAEMRHRILREAVELIRNPDKAAEFDSQLAAYYQAADRPEFSPRPLTALQTARGILTGRSKLRVTTIDALFLDWVSKFPKEAFGTDRSPLLITPGIGIDAATLNQKAWRGLCRSLAATAQSDTERDPHWELILHDDAIEGLRERLFELDQHRSFLWQQRRQGQTPHSFLPEREPISPGAFLQRIRPLITQLCGHVTHCGATDRGKQTIQRATAALSQTAVDQLVQGLHAAGLLNKDYVVSAGFLRGRKRDQVLPLIHEIDQLIREQLDHRRIMHLNDSAEAYLSYYQLFCDLRAELKKRLHVCDFEDLTHGMLQLFSSPAGLSLQYLISRTVSHLMIDEFQDTSRAQWRVFATIAEELLAGYGSQPDASLLRPTVFIVGDKRQSIYGFREAEPRVLDEAQRSLSAHHVHLRDSYRSSQIVLDFVDRVFSLHQEDEKHRTATLAGVSIIPNHGWIRVLACPPAASSPPSPSSSDHDPAKGGDQAEAKALVASIQEALAQKSPVFAEQGSRCRQLEPRDCAILYRSGSHAVPIMEALRQAGLPFQREEAGGLFDRPEVQDGVALLKALALPADALSLLTVLRSPMVGLSPAQMMPLLQRGHELRHTDAEGGRRRATATALAMALRELYPDLAFEIERSRSHLISRPIDQALEDFMRRLDSRLRYQQIAESADAGGGLASDGETPTAVVGNSTLAHIDRLIDIIGGLHRGQRLGAVAIIDELTRFAESDEWGAVPATGNAIRLMTIHKAKGLEFPLVGIFGCGKAWAKQNRYWTKVHRSKNEGMAPADYRHPLEDDNQCDQIAYIGKSQDRPRSHSGFQSALDDSEKIQREECERLLYVAMTRARNYLLLSGQESEQTTGLKSTVFLPHLVATLAEQMTDYQQTEIAENVRECRSEVASQLTPPEVASQLTPPETTATSSDTINLAPSPMAKAMTKTRDDIIFSAPSQSDSQVTERDAVHKFLRPTSSQNRIYARARGVMIHALLDHSAKYREPDIASLWQQTLTKCGFDPHRTPERVDKALENCIAEWQRVVDSSYWRELLSSAAEIRSEMPIVSRRGETITHGTIDLVAITRDGLFESIRIVDYKTLPIKPKLDTYDLKALAEVAGYSAQMRAYEQAASHLWPSASIQMEVFFTKTCQGVTL